MVAQPDRGRLWAWGAFVLSAPTLGAALLRASSVMPFHSSVDQARLVTEGATSRYCYEFGLRGHAAYPDLAFSAIGVFLSIFRHFLGSHWRPMAVLLDFDPVPSPGAVEDTYGCPAIWNAGQLGLRFATDVLPLSRRGPRAHRQAVTVHDIARERAGGPPKTVSDQVAALALHQLDDAGPSIDATARSLGLGVRTLQRRLDEEGGQYRQIVSRVRMIRACELLSGSDETVSEIAKLLGYESYNNFSRAFKTATGGSPTEYRRMHRRNPSHL